MQFHNNPDFQHRSSLYFVIAVLILKQFSASRILKMKKLRRWFDLVKFNFLIIHAVKFKNIQEIRLELTKICCNVGHKIGSKLVTTWKYTREALKSLFVEIRHEVAANPRIFAKRFAKACNWITTESLIISYFILFHGFPHLLVQTIIMNRQTALQCHYKNYFSFLRSCTNFLPIHFQNN